MNFFQIHVPMWMWWLSQAIGVVAIVLTFIAIQQKTKSRQLFVQSSINVIMLAANLLILNMSMVAIGVVLIVQNFSLALINTKEDKLPNWFKVFAFIFFSTLYTAAMFSVWWFWNQHWSWFNYVLLAISIFMIYVKVFRNIHWMKWSIFANNWLLIVNAVMYANIMSVVKSFVKITSVLLFYHKYQKTKQQSTI